MSGGGVTVQANDAGVGSGSRRRRSRSREGVRADGQAGQVHRRRARRNAAASTEHSNDEPASLDENENDAVVAGVDAGGDAEIVDSGGVESTVVHSSTAGVGSMIPAASIARTANV